MKMKIDASVAFATLLALTLLIIPLTAGPSPLPQKNPTVPGTFANVAGVCVIDLATGETVTDINASRQFIPASVTKAVTTASVMCLKDSAERFVTPVAALGRINGQTLEGNVIVSVTGDPTIQSRHLEATHGMADSIAAGLKALGINRVTGRVIIDDSGFAESGIPDGWMNEDLTQTYGAELQAANYADNTVRLSIPSGSTVPSTPGLQVNMEGGKGGARLSRPRDSRSITVRGSAGRRGTTVTIANPLPASTMRDAIESRMKAAGITVDGGNVEPQGTTTLIYTHVSPRYVDIMRSLMVRSDNLFAEGMLRTLAPGESRESALQEELDIWKDNEVDMRGVLIEDGSGLSRNNRLTPRFLAEVLEWMSGSLVGDSYVRLFPRTGHEGTVRKFLKGTPLEGRMVLKTGSMRGVQSYAGYMLDEYGRPSHAVVVMCNNFKDRSRLRATITDVLMEIFCPQAEVPDEIAEGEAEEPSEAE